MKMGIRKRGLYYGLGMVILALGLVLNSQSGLGISPIISVAYSFSVISGVGFPNTTLMLYIVFVIVEIVIHQFQKKRRMVMVLDILQIPLSIVFTRFMKLYLFFIPEFSQTSMGIRFGVLLLAILCTGIGAALTLKMRIIPNPGDGIVQAISDAINKSVGLTKNGVDIFCIMLSLIMGYVFVGYPAGIGIGTLIAMIGTGRCIAGFNYLTRHCFSEYEETENNTSV